MVIRIDDGESIMARGAIYVENSKNEKIAGLGKCDGTYASIRNTCPDTCVLKKSKECYATQNYVALIVKRLDRRARQDNIVQMARNEAKCIDESYRGGKVPSGRDLRVHISGDARSRTAAKIISRAVGRWLDRQEGEKGSAWAYTHCFASVPRESWGRVSVLASIESIDQVAEATKQGYACALIVPEHASSKAYKLPNCEITWIPCPAQEKPGGKEIACVDCRLCMKSDWLRDSGRGISFSAHGSKKSDLKKHLTVIR